jgi:uncharacterized protein with ParB-like and HNH nuclease domain
MSELQKGIWSVTELFNNKKHLMIPKYQRPYKWSVNNVLQLINDIKRESEKNVSAYRLGTIVLHEESNIEDEKQNFSNGLNIVDGQQRTITLFLILKALQDLLNADKLDLSDNIRQKLKEIPTSKFNPEFTSDISKENIYNNYQFIKQNLTTFDAKTIEFLLNKCQVVFFILNDISEAFQFFDSQNSRGKDLEPHDLLKAYHLREMADDNEATKAKVIENWENEDSDMLATLFDEFLFKVKNWSRLRSARSFTKNEIYLFKGANLNKHNYPYGERLKMINYVVNRVEHYQPISYPFQLSEPIISGKGFFDFIRYYNDIYKRYQFNNNPSLLMSEISDKTTQIFKLLKYYKNRNRIGDEYVREMFDCAVLYYWDKFGENQLDLAIEKLFIWAYSLRLELARVGLPATDNYAIGINGRLQVFEIIRNAIYPDDVINELQNFKVPARRGDEDDEIRKLFEELNYHGK